MKNKKRIYILSGIVLGLLGGFIYWRFVGCTSGTCPITSNWHTSTIMGGIFGYLLADSFKFKEKKEEAEDISESKKYQ